MFVKNEQSEREYCERRAHEERCIAVQCENNAAALAHLRMAEEYDKRAGQPHRGR